MEESVYSEESHESFESEDDLPDIYEQLQCALDEKCISSIQNCLEIIKKKSLSNGVPANIFEVLIDVLFADEIGLSLSVDILRVLIPVSKVQDSHLDTLLWWYFSCEDNASTLDPRTEFIYWLLVVLEYSLVDSHVLQMWFGDFLNHLFKTDDKNLASSLAKLLSQIVEPYLISANDLSKLKELSEEPSNKEYKFLLSVFTALCPDSETKLKPVKKPLTLTNIKIDKDLTSAAEECAKRLGLHCKPKESQNYSTSSKSVIYGQHFYEDMYKGYVKLHQLNSLNELISLEGRVALPVDPLHLLSSSIAIQFLSLAPLHIQLQFNERLFHLRTEDVFSDVPLLEAICDLQDRSMFGIPAMSKHLVQFLRVWDGYELRPTILRLIHWLYWNNFDDLVIQILAPILRLFVTSEDSVKADLISALSTLVINNLIVTRTRLEDPTGLMFTEKAPEWWDDFEICIDNLNQVIGILIHTGLRLSAGSTESKFIHQSLVHFSQMCVIESTYPLERLTAAVPDLFYAALFSSNQVAIDCACSLLIRYKKMINNFETSMAGEVNTTLERISNDFFYLLWNNKDESYFNNGYLVTVAESDELRVMSRSLPIKKCLHVKKHYALSPYINEVLKRSDLNLHSCSEEDIIEVVRDLFPGIGRLIDYYESLNNQHVN